MRFLSRQTIFREYKAEFGLKINRPKTYLTDSVLQSQRMEDHKGYYYTLYYYVAFYANLLINHKC